VQTNLPVFFKQTSQGLEAESILRSCVHCGFCNATCPTYQALSDERDGPRGRIYLIRELLEGAPVSEKTRLHLDRCLSCRSCETSCPSGVEYGRLLDIGRNVIEQQLSRPLLDRLLRKSLRLILPYSHRFKFFLTLGQWLRPVMPKRFQEKIPLKVTKTSWPVSSHKRIMLSLSGCVQSATSPNTNAATARVLDRLGITLVEVGEQTCCGAMSYHLSAQEEAKRFMRRNIDAWWPAILDGAEAIVMTASGCGVTVKEYGDILKHDVEYADKARRVSDLTKDISEILLDEDLSILQEGLKANKKNNNNTTSIHCPCSLQHGQQLPNVMNNVLKDIGFNLVPSQDPHLCCGSAGTYSLLQEDLSERLLDNKINALTVNDPDRIVTANIGCQLHLERRANIPVSHWIELLDREC